MEIELRLDMDDLSTIVAALIIFDQDLHEAMNIDIPGIIGDILRQSARDAHDDMLKLRTKIENAMGNNGIPKMEVEPQSDMGFTYPNLN